MGNLKYNANGEVVGAVELMGSNVDVTWQAPLAITDTTARFLSTIDLSEAGEFYLVIQSTLDQIVVFNIDAINGHDINGYTASGADALGLTYSIPIGTPARQLRVARPSGLGFATSLKGFLKCATAPTVGSVSVYIAKKGKGI